MAGVCLGHVVKCLSPRSPLGRERPLSLEDGIAMRKACVIALVLLGLGAGPAAALDVKDVRSTYGPFGGARPGNKFLPGDVLWLAFQIDDLAMEADTGLVKYKVKLEVTDVRVVLIAFLSCSEGIGGKKQRTYHSTDCCAEQRAPSVSLWMHAAYDFSRGTRIVCKRLGLFPPVYTDSISG